MSNKQAAEFLQNAYAITGELTASHVVALAEPENSPIHHLFEWDDGEAAARYRLNQARTLIRKVNVFIQKREDRFVHVPVISARSAEGVYRTISAVVGQPDQFEAALSQALKVLSAAEKAVHDLRAVAGEHSPDRAAIIAVVLEGLKTANSAMAELH